jgi:hypothetical protein
MSVLGLALLVLLVGCAKPAFFEKESQPEYYKKDYKSHDLDLKDFEAGGVASAGIVVRDGVEIARTPDLPPENRVFDHAVQVETFSPTLEWKFAERFRKPAIVKFHDLDDFVPDDLLEAIWNKMALGGYLAPEILEAIHATEPGVRYLLLGRVEQDQVSTDINTAIFMGQQQYGGVAQDSGAIYNSSAANNSRPPTIQRKVGFVLALFDLETARCIWEDRHMVELHETTDPDSITKMGDYEVREKQGGEYSIEEIEDLSGAPTFTEALENGMGKLLKEMQKAMGDQRPRSFN